MIGVLHASRLAQALGRSAPRARVGGEALAGLVARGYWDAVAGLARAAITALPQDARVLPEEK
jgi:hypothetical protein